MIKDWENKKVAVLGLGAEGVSTVRFLSKKGAKIWILDKKRIDEIDKEFLSDVAEIRAELVLGEKYLDNLTRFDVIVRSPGISVKRQELQDARKKGVEITSQTKIFFDLCPCPIIGVTGTKGKGTTSTLIYEMLKRSGRDAYLGGNIGKPSLDFLEQLTPRSIVVLELSSFQLQDLQKSAFIAVMLMTTSEHLDYHGDTREYVDAKRNLLRFQDTSDFAVINRDYPASNESDIFTQGQVFFVTRERSTAEQGAFIKDNAIWMRMQGVTSNPSAHSASSGSSTGSGQGVTATEWKIIDIDKIALPGKHNWENAAAAAMAATLGGASKEDIVEVLKTFKGLPHRLELVREVKGVRYYDDSFSTTPETAIAAIEAFKEPEILILGGSGKNSDFAELAQVIGKANNIKAIIGIGSEWERIKKQISIFHFPFSNKKEENFPFLIVEGAKNMSQIVQAASKIAKAGDMVLLSPGCASFDMFKNYKDRGDQFKREVNSLI